MTKEVIKEYKIGILNTLSFHYKTFFLSIMNNSKEELTRSKDNVAHIRVLTGANSGEKNFDLAKKFGLEENWTFPKVNKYVYVSANGFDNNFTTRNKAENIPFTLREEVFEDNCDKLFLHKREDDDVYYAIFTNKELSSFKPKYSVNSKYQTVVTFDIPFNRTKFQKQSNKQYKYKYENRDMQKIVDNFKPEYLGSVRYTDKQFRNDIVCYITDENDKYLKEVRSGSWRNLSKLLNAMNVPVKDTQLQYLDRRGYRRFLMRRGEQERRFYMTKENKTLYQLIEETSFLRKKGSKDLIVKVDGKYKTTKETLRTKNWVTVVKYEKENELTYDDFTKPQICVNKPLDLSHPNRKSDFVHKQNYLFECDNISLEKQVKLINEELPPEIQNSILWACYSGGKSIHVVITTNTPDDATRDERKYIHNWINSVFFNLQADPSGQNANRLARTPNAIRDNGRIQKAFLINDDKAIPFDVMPFLEPYRQQKRDLEQKLLEMRESRAYSGMSTCTLAALKSWNTRRPSKAKQECIDCLEGNLKDWNRTAACIRTLSNWGWSAEDILSEGPYDDKWIKSAIKILSH